MVPTTRFRRARHARRYIALAGAVLCLAACGGVASRVDPARTSMAPEAYVVAFSFDTRALTGAGAWPFMAAYVDVGSGPLFDVSGERPELNLVLLEVPGPSFAFRSLEFVERKSEYREQWYRTSVAGPTAELVPGTVTYLGSLIVTTARVDGESGSTGELGLRIEDKWDADAAYWRHQFPLLQARPPSRRTAPPWSVSGHVSLAETRARGQPQGDEPFIYRTMRTKRRSLPGSEPD